MEEKKTAAIVLSILALITIFFFGVLPYINRKRTYTLSYKSCTVHFKYAYQVDTTDDGFVAAQNELALCLCNAYEKKHDTDIARQIMKLNKKYGNYISPDSANHSPYSNIDSVLKYKNTAFNPKIMVD